MPVLQPASRPVKMSRKILSSPKMSTPGGINETDVLDIFIFLVRPRAGG